MPAVGMGSVRRMVIEETTTIRPRRNFAPLLLLPLLAVGAGLVGATGTDALHRRLVSAMESNLTPELRSVIGNGVTLGGEGTRLVLRGTVETAAQRAAIGAAAARARALGQGAVVNDIVVRPVAASTRPPTAAGAAGVGAAAGTAASASAPASSPAPALPSAVQVAPISGGPSTTTPGSLGATAGPGPGPASSPGAALPGAALPATATVGNPSFIG